MTDIVWNSLLELKKLISSLEKKQFSFQVLYHENGFHVHPDVADNLRQSQISFNFESHSDHPVQINFSIDKNFEIQSQSSTSFIKEQHFIRTYLPYCISTLKSHKLKRAYGISHYAQSLDGKVATVDGHSKWISDQENLTHCHRMRALCDGILIGINTLRNDKPQLNVRHVKGSNPTKIIVGSSSSSFTSLLQNKGAVILFTRNPTSILQGVEQIAIPETSTVPAFIMQKLYQMGIHSVFIEGGSQTTSSFLEHRVIDEIQLYLAPSVFGSGLPNFSLPPIKHVNEAVTFAKHEFELMGQGVFFRGEVLKVGHLIVDNLT